ncbi:MAG: DUF1549 domain-containing protein, partial [Planctomycetaceae bacterium]
MAERRAAIQSTDEDRFSVAAVANRTDAHIGLPESSADPADDYTFLRRVYLDVVGRPATPAEITAFGFDPDPDKRDRLVERLLKSNEYSANWTRYWRDTIFSRATNVRAGLVRPAFAQWMNDQLSEGAGWDQIVTELLTATGPVNDNGASALIFAHEGVPEEIAAEASRLFTGIQIQCANCHDHPWDQWKREQFHELVAFFPRISVRRERGSDNMFDYEIASVNNNTRTNPALSRFFLTRLDRNRDGAISESEAKETPIARIFAQPQARENIDKNGDGRITIDEIANARPPENRPGQGKTEHFMPDLSDPASEGTRIDPRFFVTGQRVRTDMTDEERRTAVARLITSKSNPWFAKAIVNRMWYELTGTAFYTPVDDIGPGREVRHEAALESLCEGFIHNNYDLKWLIRAITRTAVYQRSPNSDGDGFQHCEPTRLRADQLYSALCQTLNVSSLPIRSADVRPGMMYRNGQADPGRESFSRVFGFDPSVSRSELTGSIPEALFMMNSPEVQRIIAANRDQDTVSQLLTRFTDNDSLISEMYLRCLGREPRNSEV